MFCFLSHIIEDGYFSEIEMMFLVVGHTHNILDQWFSVLGKAVRGADFIGSVLAIHELYKIAHTDDEAKQPALVHQLQTYHDWRRFYDPIRNAEIQNYGIPLRFKLSLDNFLNVAKMEYMHMSPSHGFMHMEKWQPVTVGTKQNTDVDGSIPLTPLVVFNGAAKVIEALGLNKSGPNTLTDFAVANKEDFDKLDEFTEILPVLRELEVKAIGETVVRMEQEADCGKSDEKVVASAALHKKIEREIKSNNSSAGGRIVWLRRAKCADPNYLRGRPDVLPNPSLWRQRIANGSVAKNVLESMDSSTLSQTKTDSVKNKKIATDAAEAQQRLISFQRGAADMAATASAMIKLVDENKVIPIASHNNILLATNKFKRTFLTPREVEWYRNISTARQIGLREEARAAEEEKKEWRLLNLPEETPAQKKRKEEQIREREKRSQEVEEKLRSLLVRDGEGEYNPDKQVVSFDGFAPAKTQDLDKMTRPQLEALVKGRLKSKDIKALKVDVLRARVKKMVEEHPDMLLIPTTSTTTDIAATTADHAEENENIENQVKTNCSVQEVKITFIAIIFDHFLKLYYYHSYYYYQYYF